MKRIVGVAVSLLMLFAMLSGMTVSAQELSLLVQEKSSRTSMEGDFAYDGSGALCVTASSDAGATVAINIEQTINLNGTRYVHLVVDATAPFNIALKVSNGSHDVYPQLAGPSWYERFQETAPAMGEGVKAGNYALVLDLWEYMNYNAQSLGTDGYAYIRSVHVFVKDAGAVTVKQLKLTDAPTFTHEGQPITTAVPLEAVTTAPHAETDATQPPSTDATVPVYPVAPEGDYDLGRLPPTVIVLLVGAVLLIGATIALTVIKKKKKKK